MQLLDQRPANVIREISPADGMYELDPEGYFETGESALRCVRLAMLAAGKSTATDILDFACGHGRVLRMLEAAFPEARLTACDIKRDAVDFCSEVFGATPVYAREDPGEIDIRDEFDLIWVGSLLTHIDAVQWPGFLDLFDSLLRADGILVFTVAGRYVVQRMREGERLGLTDQDVRRLLEDYERTGFGFCRQDYPTNPARNLGLARAAPSWVLGQLERLPGLRLLSYMERGWYGRQDVVACVRDESRAG